jgi:uncharacterized protein
MNAKQCINQASLDEVIRRIVEVAEPDRIILFGSAARGEMGPHSDLDLLVIKSGNVDKLRLAQKIYRNMGGVDYAVDIIVATSGDIARYGNSIGLVYKPALHEGRVVYDAA